MWWMSMMKLLQMVPAARQALAAMRRKFVRHFQPAKGKLLKIQQNSPGRCQATSMASWHSQSHPVQKHLYYHVSRCAHVTYLYCTWAPSLSTTKQTNVLPVLITNSDHKHFRIGDCHCLLTATIISQGIPSQPFNCSTSRNRRITLALFLLL